MLDWLLFAVLAIVVVGTSIGLTLLMKKFCEDDFNPDNW